jgi:hypothetical protein
MSATAARVLPIEFDEQEADPPDTLPRQPVPPMCYGARGAAPYRGSSNFFLSPVIDSALFLYGQAQ